MCVCVCVCECVCVRERERERERVCVPPSSVFTEVGSVTVADGFPSGK